jgi:hypothetical protein
MIPPLARGAAAALVVLGALTALSGCTPETTAQPDDAAAVTATQASFTGEWVLTRTVVSSDDATNPEHVVGAVSTRAVMLERDSCADALCPGTVTSGATVAARESTPFTQTDGGLTYVFRGSLDCMNTVTGGVLVVDAFDYSQQVVLTTGDVVDNAASSIAGTISYTDTLNQNAIDRGCIRDPSTVNVEYTVTGVRAPQ